MEHQYGYRLCVRKGKGVAQKNCSLNSDGSGVNPQCRMLTGFIALDRIRYFDA